MNYNDMKYRQFQSRVQALPVCADPHKENACDFDRESIPAGQDIRVFSREYPQIYTRLTHSCVSRV